MNHSLFLPRTQPSHSDSGCLVLFSVAALCDCFPSWEGKPWESISHMILSPGLTLCLISAPKFRLWASISPCAVLYLDRASVQNPSVQVAYCWVQQYGTSWTRSQMPQTPEDPLLPGKAPCSRAVTANKMNGHAEPIAARLGVRR